MEETRSPGSEEDFQVSRDLKDFRTNSDKEEGIKALVTFLKSLKNSLVDRKAKDPVDKEEEWASNKARISF